MKYLLIIYYDNITIYINTFILIFLILFSNVQAHAFQVTVYIYVFNILLLFSIKYLLIMYIDTFINIYIHQYIYA